MKFGMLAAIGAALSLALAGVAQAAMPASGSVRASGTSLPTAKGFRAGPRSGKKKGNLLGAAPVVSALLVAGAVAATVVVADQVASNGDSN